METIMRKHMVVFIALAVLAAGGTAWGADSNTLTVAASVKGTCKFSTANSTLNFGELDPSSLDPVNRDTTTGFWCTKNLVTQIQFVADYGLNSGGGTTRQMKHSASNDLIPYSLTLSPGVGANQGPTFPRTLTISGTVLAADFREKSEGSYSDTVVITFSP
jgi:spore coat protein U-like protein